MGHDYSRCSKIDVLKKKRELKVEHLQQNESTSRTHKLSISQNDGNATNTLKHKMLGEDMVMK